MSNTVTSKYIEFPEMGKVICTTEEISIDNLAPTEVVIENEASVISAGTELARLHGLESDTSFPARPGYGSIGRIIAKGSDVDDFEIGAHVFFAGRHASIQRFNHKEDHQWAYLFPVPEDMNPVHASIGCMAQIAATAPNLANVSLNDTVAVFGLGMVGMLAACMFKLKGARVIGVDPVAHRCELAKQMGIETTVCVPAAEQVDALMELTGGVGVDMAVDAVGHAGVIANAAKSCRLFGEIYLLGSPRAPIQGNLTEVFSLVHLNCLKIIGAHMWQYPVDEQRGVKMSCVRNFDTMFDLIRSGKLDVAPLISHVIGPEQVADTYLGLQDNPEQYTCAVIKWK